MAAQQLTRETTLNSTVLSTTALSTAATVSSMPLVLEGSTIAPEALTADAAAKSRRRSTQSTTAKPVATKPATAKPATARSTKAAPTKATATKAASAKATATKVTATKVTATKATATKATTVAKTSTSRQRSATKSLSLSEVSAECDLAEKVLAEKVQMLPCLQAVSQEIELMTQSFEALTSIVDRMNQLQPPQLTPIARIQPIARKPAVAPTARSAVQPPSAPTVPPVAQPIVQATAQTETQPTVQPAAQPIAAAAPNYWGASRETSAVRSPAAKPTARSTAKPINLPELRSPTADVPPVLKRLAEQQRQAKAAAAQSAPVQPAPVQVAAKPTLIRMRPSEPIPPLFASNAPAPIVQVPTVQVPTVQVQTPRPARLRSPQRTLNRRYTLAYLNQLFLQILPIPSRPEAIVFDAALWTASALGLRLLAHLLMELIPLLSFPLHLLLLCPALLAAYLAFCVPKSSTPFVYRCLLLTLGFFFGSRLI